MDRGFSLDGWRGGALGQRGVMQAFGDSSKAEAAMPEANACCLHSPGLY
jgi:hypothetical protein